MDVVLQGPRTSPEPPRALDRSASLGALIGAIVALIPGAWGLAERSWGGLGMASLIGVPTAIVLGTWLGPRIRGGSNADTIGHASLMAAAAVEAPAIAIGGIAVLGGLPGMGLGAVIILPLAMIFGLWFLVVTIPAAIVWTLVMRLLPASLVRDGRTPIRSRRARVIAVAVVLAIAGSGVVPFAAVALEGRACVDVGGEDVAELAWTPDGTRLYAIVFLHEGMALVEIDMDAGASRTIRTTETWMSALAIDAAGVPWWLEADHPEQTVWRADPEPVAAGPTALADVVLMWWEGDRLHLLDGGWDRGSPSLHVVDPTTDGFTRPERVDAPWLAQVDDQVFVSGDGSTLGWLASEGGDWEAWSPVVRIVVNGTTGSIPVPMQAWDAALSHEGHSLVYGTDDGWHVLPLVGTERASRVADEGWMMPRMHGERLAMVRAGFQAGAVCLHEVPTAR